MGDIARVALARKRLLGCGETEIGSALPAITDQGEWQVGPCCDRIDRAEARGFDARYRRQTLNG